LFLDAANISDKVNMSEITRTPLTWPNNVARTAPQLRTWPKFDLPSISVATNLILQEINRLNKRRWDYADQSVIISTNLTLRKDGLPISDQREPADTGAAVYFMLQFRRNGKPFERPCVLTCDKWNKVGYNLGAISRDIEAQRARERWGCSTIEQAFQGYLCIPERTGGKSWWETLGVPPNANAFQINEAYRIKAKQLHPDVGGSNDDYLKLKEAYDQAMGQLSTAQFKTP
jgi:hypothetical protein